MDDIITPILKVILAFYLFNGNKGNNKELKS